MTPDQTLQCEQGFTHDPIKRVFHLGFLLDIDDILVGQRPCQELVDSLGLLPLVQVAHDGAYRHAVSSGHSRTFPVIALDQPFVHQPFETLDRFTIGGRDRPVVGVVALHLGDGGRMDHLVSQRFRRRIGQINDSIFNVDFPVETIDISFITIWIIVLFPTIHAFRGAKYHLIITVRQGIEGSVQHLPLGVWQLVIQGLADRIQSLQVSNHCPGGFISLSLRTEGSHEVPAGCLNSILLLLGLFHLLDRLDQHLSHNRGRGVGRHLYSAFLLIRRVATGHLIDGHGQLFHGFDPVADVLGTIIQSRTQIIEVIVQFTDTVDFLHTTGTLFIAGEFFSQSLHLDVERVRGIEHRFQWIQPQEGCKAFRDVLNRVLGPRLHHSSVGKLRAFEHHVHGQVDAVEDGQHTKALKTLKEHVDHATVTSADVERRHTTDPGNTGREGIGIRLVAIGQVTGECLGHPHRVSLVSDLDFSRGQQVAPLTGTKEEGLGLGVDDRTIGHQALEDVVHLTLREEISSLIPRIFFRVNLTISHRLH